VAEQLKVYELTVIYRFEATDDVIASAVEAIRINEPTWKTHRVLGHAPIGANYRCLGFYTRHLTWVPADGTPDPGVAVR
jgi:hypothetical protein